MGKKNIILVDYDTPQKWEFHKAIEKITEEKWEVHKAVSNKNHGGYIQKVIRYTKYFLVPIKFAKNYRNYHKVIAWQQFYGIIMAFYLSIFHVQNAPEIVVLTFIYKPKKNFVGKVYDKFMKYIVNSGYVKYYVVFSESEKKWYADYFNVSESKFIFEILGYEDKTKEIPLCDSEKFYLAAGRSNRDYKFLVETWKERKEHLKIICDTFSLKNIPDNIEILTDCHDNDFFSELARCKAVIVPLEDTHISSGQLVIIQAMMYGKPIIITENDTVEDYVDNGRTGLVIKKTDKDLENAIDYLSNEIYYEKMSDEERKKYESIFSIFAMGTRIGNLLN